MSKFEKKKNVTKEKEIDASKEWCIVYASFIIVFFQNSLGFVNESLWIRARKKYTVYTGCLLLNVVNAKQLISRKKKKNAERSLQDTYDNSKEKYFDKNFQRHIKRFNCN